MSNDIEYTIKHILDICICLLSILGCLSLIIIPMQYTEKEEYKIKLIEHNVATYTVDIHGIAKFVYLDDKKETTNDGDK